MFSISKKFTDGFELIELKEITSGTVASIVPSMGATLHSFCVQHNNATLNVIDFYDNAADFNEHVTSKGFKSCKLSPFACRMKDASYKLNGKNYTVKKHILKGSALHGLLYDVAFKVTDESVTDSSASVTVTYQYNADDNGYPFKYTCTVCYTLKTNNELVISTSVTNNDKETIPMQDGWHPYFTFGKTINNLHLEFKSAEHILFDEALLPNGKTEEYTTYAALKKIEDTFFDDCFLLSDKIRQPMCVLKDTEAGIQVEIRPDNSYPYLQIYTPPQRNSIAIENLSAPPDAFNNGIDLLQLASGNTVVFTTSYIITATK